MDNGGGGLVHHHLVLVPQAALNEVEQRAVVTERTKAESSSVNHLQGSLCAAASVHKPARSPSLRLVQQFAGDPDEHAVGEGRLEARFGELVEHFGDRETVVLPEVIQQAQGVILQERTRLVYFRSACDVKFQSSQQLSRVCTTHLDHDVVTGGSFLGFIHPTLHHIVAHLHHVLNTQTGRIHSSDSNDVV